MFGIFIPKLIVEIILFKTSVHRAKARYIYQKHCDWQRGKKLPFIELCEEKKEFEKAKNQYQLKLMKLNNRKKSQ